MNYICLSLAPNLRCQDLTKAQSAAIFAPAAVEALFSLILAFADSSLRGPKRWILVIDGLSFFSLALLDLLAHLVSGISSSQQAFSVLDFVIAALSFIPLFAYLSFLLLFANSNLRNSIPSRFRLMLTVLLSVAIPLVITFNELGSLLGVSHQSLAAAGKAPVLAVGFLNDTFQRISVFFSSITLVLLVLFQVSLFTLTFVRVVRAFIDERRFEEVPRNPTEQIHLFRGLGWLSLGLKLGAIESVVGFAENCFAVVLTRRLLRLFGRGAVIIGVIKGLNIVEDFVQFETHVRAIRSERSSPVQEASRLVISNPRTSTFQQLSPSTTNFHTAQIEKRIKRTSLLPLTLGSSSTFDKLNGRSGIQHNMPTVPQRVTVHYDGKAAPVLDVRFSKLSFSGIPAPVKTRLSAIEEGSRQETESMERVLDNHASLASNWSTASNSSSSSSSEAVLELASRFPSLPPHATTPTTSSRRDNWHFSSPVPSRPNSHLHRNNRAMSSDIGSAVSYPSVVDEQVGYYTPFAYVPPNQNAISRFSMSSASAEDEEWVTLDNTTRTNPSFVLTPRLSSGPTTNTASLSVASPPFEIPVSGWRRVGSVGVRSFDGRTSSQISSFAGDTADRRVESLMKSRSREIGCIDDIVNDTWRYRSKIRIRSLSPAQRTPPAQMSPMQRSMSGIEDVFHSQYGIDGNALEIALEKPAGFQFEYI